MKTFNGLGMKVLGYPDLSREHVATVAREAGYLAIESFCGPGGMGLGLEWAGFNVAAAFDFDEPSTLSYRHNLRGHCSVLDAKATSGKQLLSISNSARGEVALFAGGPPCQGFSKQKRGAHLGDERNDLVFEYIRLVSEIQPRYFLFENVAIFGQVRGKRYLMEMQRRLPEYAFATAFLNAADFGVPQTRERFVLVGRRKDEVGRFRFPLATTRQRRTVRDVIGDLPEPPSDGSEHPDLPNHAKTNVTAINIQRFTHVPQGGGWQDIPSYLRLPCHQNVDPSSGGWPDVYGRLSWDGPCPTITGGFDSFTRGRYGHPTQHRAITPREAARMQGFPDNYRFIGNRGDVRSQIGNVVPPPLAEAVGLEILRCLLTADGLLPGEDVNCVELGDLFEAC